MKTNTKSNSGLLSRALSTQILTASAAVLCVFIVPRATAQVYVFSLGGPTITQYDSTSGAQNTNYNYNGAAIPDYANGPMALSGGNLFAGYPGTVDQSNAATGADINPDFVVLNGSPTVTSLAVAGNNLFVSSFDVLSGQIISNSIGEYDATTGAPINSTLVSGVAGSLFAGGLVLAASGGHLFVWNTYSGHVSEYDSATGALLNANLCASGTSDGYLAGFTVSGNSIYVSPDGGPVSVYDATTGATITNDLIQIPSLNTNNISGLAVSGNDLFFTNEAAYEGGPFEGGGAVAEVDATTGATINANFVTGTEFESSVLGVAVGAPEPTSAALLLGGGALLALRRRRSAAGV